MSAAVADFTPKKAAENKIKKGDELSDLTLDLRPTRESCGNSDRRRTTRACRFCA